MLHKNFRLMFTIYFVIFGIFIALFESLISYKIQMDDIKDRIDHNAEEVAYTRKNNALAPRLEKMDSMVKALSTSRILQEYLQHPNQKNKENVSHLFYAIAMSDNYIMQTRYIDEKGQERIRIDRLDESSIPFVAEDSKFQDKSSRDYFQTVSKMKPETIWHSKLDLNIENNKIEIPYKPTIRVATPLYIDNKYKGIVIINILTTKLLSNLRTSTVFDHYVIDKEGNIILHPNDKLSWSKYTGSKAKLIDDFPTEASQIVAGIRKGENFYAYPLDDILQNEDDAVLILKPKEEYKQSLVTSNIESALLVIILSILLSIPLALYASLIPSKIQKALWYSNRDLKRFADIIDKYVITVTTKTNSIITAVSSAFAKASGYTKEELIGQKINIIKHPETPKKVFHELWKTIEQGKEWHGEIKNRGKEGNTYWIEETIIPVKEDNNDITSYITVGIDISAKKELEVISTIDRLTEIFNRRKLDELLHHETEKAKRYKRDLTLLMIDIDHFKHVNDTYGHQTGDYALSTVAKILSTHIRESDILGRYGGEEFMIICPETDKNAAFQLGEKLRNTISDYAFNTIGHLTISIGIGGFETDDDTQEEAIRKTDNALYKAKERGRNQVVIGE